jgi:hypothetical protein
MQINAGRVTILRTVLRELTTRIQNRNFCGSGYRLFFYANESARGPARGAHSHPITSEPACSASLHWLALATRYPNNPVYQLIAWSCGLLHDQIEQNARRILHAILALDSADGRGYFYFMMAVADRLPSPFKEHVMNELKDYRFLFPIHDHEFDLVEKGERQGIEKGIELGKQAGIELGKQAGVADGLLQHAMATLERLDPAAAAQLEPCTELQQWDAAIDHAIQQLKAGPGN